ncbi:MAG: NAD(P)H-dependent oxidoreductase subunit E [Bacteroides sp.]|nr:NAD(P)H-dependent oxidoreductase subunit E [Bacteroides sp.]
MSSQKTDPTALVNQTARQFTRVLEIMEKYHHDQKRLITILQEVQEEYRYLPQQVLTYIATALDMPVAEVFGVATFYAHFSLQAKGKYVIKVCDGTACHVKGSTRLIDLIYKKLNLSAQKHTTNDMLFTIEAVSCLGACGLAPVMVVNEKVYGEVNPQKCEEILNGIMQQENK